MSHVIEADNFQTPQKITVKKMDDPYGSFFERKAMPIQKILTKPTGAFLAFHPIAAPVFSRGEIDVERNGEFYDLQKMVI